MNTDYLFSMTEDDADREQELLYRSQLQEVDLNYLYSIAYTLHVFCDWIMKKQNKKIGLSLCNIQYLLCLRLNGRPCWAANTDPVCNN